MLSSRSVGSSQPEHVALQAGGSLNLSQIWSVAPWIPAWIR